MNFGVNLGFSREYGRASPGQRAVGHRPCNTGGNVTVVAGLSRHGIIAPLIFPGASNGEIFKNYVEKVLAPELAPGDTALMDNLSAHKVQGIEDIQRFLYLPVTPKTKAKTVDIANAMIGRP